MHSKWSTDIRSSKGTSVCPVSFCRGWGRGLHRRQRGRRERAGRAGFCATWTKAGEFERHGKTGQGRDVVGAKGWVCRANPSCMCQGWSPLPGPGRRGIHKGTDDLPLGRETVCACFSLVACSSERSLGQRGGRALQGPLSVQCGQAGCGQLSPGHCALAAHSSGLVRPSGQR